MKYFFLLPFLLMISACNERAELFEEYLDLFPQKELPYEVNAPQVILRKENQFIPEKYLSFIKRNPEIKNESSEVLSYSYQPLAQFPLGNGEYRVVILAAFAGSGNPIVYNQVRLNLVTYYKNGELIDSKVFAYCCYDLLAGSIDADGEVAISRYKVNWEKKSVPGYENKTGNRGKLLQISYYKIAKNGEIKYKRDLDHR